MLPPNPSLIENDKIALGMYIVLLSFRATYAIWFQISSDA
jgi:hypothetical protein